jgi:hypothetical protein
MPAEEDSGSDLDLGEMRRLANGEKPTVSSDTLKME